MSEDPVPLDESAASSPSPSEMVRIAEEIASGDSEVADPEATLLAYLSVSDDIARVAAADALTVLELEAPDRVTAGLVALLSDPEWLVRNAAVEAVGSLRLFGAHSQIISVLSDDPEDIVRASAAEALGDLGAAGAVPALLSALDDPADVVRGYAAMAIGRVAEDLEDDIVAELQRRESEQSPEVRAELLAARYRLGVESALADLLALVEIADEGLAIRLANVFGDLVGRPGDPRLAESAKQLTEALSQLADRFPVVWGDVQLVVERLGRLDNEP